LSTGTILAIVIPASGILLMRFRKRWLAKFNIVVTNRITGLFAGWVPGFGILTHVGRKSGKVYRTPVNVFRAHDAFIIALTYSSGSEWVKNVLAAGGCELKTRGNKYQLSAPIVVHDPTRRRFPVLVRVVLRLVGADEYIKLSILQRVPLEALPLESSTS
jgi:deazaflavin-dependent oxidoreductase (nitroreductase family)